jgi:hypothetical protein
MAGVGGLGNFQSAGNFAQSYTPGGQADDLQDFRRRQEGNLIILDDRSILVMAFGMRYEGPDMHKYRIEGRYDIPVGYKCIIKWEEDEIVFMTRQGVEGPEYQLVYIPRVPDPDEFTLFAWNSQLHEIWDEFCTNILQKPVELKIGSQVSAAAKDPDGSKRWCDATITNIFTDGSYVVRWHHDSRQDDTKKTKDQVRPKKKDTQIFTEGPWKAFGIKNQKVQDAVTQGEEANFGTYDGCFLTCEIGDTPNLAEHLKYLGFTDEDERGDDGSRKRKTDENYVWIGQAFKDEPKPPNIKQYVKDGVTYWVDKSILEKDGNYKASFKHPFYDKYLRMLKVARAERPLPHWKSIMEFRIEFLLKGVYTWETEISKEYPPVETFENVLEMARIFGIDVRTPRTEENKRPEHYLVHVLKRALRHYGISVREKRKVKDVEDFRIMMQRYRELIKQFEHTRDEEKRARSQEGLRPLC